jgi:peptidoglycan hydrolase-like protein with peptidoglycan-binding domain
MRIVPSSPSPLLTEPEPSSEVATSRALRRGARGAEVERFQAQLERAGHPLPRWGVDGRFGRETSAALRAFQRAQGLPATGTVDGATLAALEARASRPRTPEYDALFADGVLRVTLAVGYDEHGAHRPEVAKVLTGLAARGYAPATEADASEFGLAPGISAWVRRPPAGTQDAPVVLELVTPETPNAKERFAEGMAGTELVLYGGHGRYGSGPDFDDLRSPDGNYVIGAATVDGVVTHGPNDLPETGFSSEYQLLFFSGCSTERYFDELRTLPRGKTTKNLDLVGSTRELYWNETAANLFAVLDGVTQGQDLEQLGATLDRLNRFSPEDTRQFFRGDGFHDNP